MHPFTEVKLTVEQTQAIGGKFTGQVNAVETEDGVVVEQTNRRGTKKVLLRLSYAEACELALRLAAAGRHSFG